MSTKVALTRQQLVCESSYHWRKTQPHDRDITQNVPISSCIKVITGNVVYVSRILTLYHCNNAQCDFRFSTFSSVKRPNGHIICHFETMFPQV